MKVMSDRSHHPVTLPWQRIISTQSAAAAAVVNQSGKKLENEDSRLATESLFYFYRTVMNALGANLCSGVCVILAPVHMSCLTYSFTYLLQ